MEKRIITTISLLFVSFQIFSLEVKKFTDHIDNPSIKKALTLKTGSPAEYGLKRWI